MEEPNLQPPSSKTTAVLVVILLLILVGFGVFYFTQKYYTEPQDKLQEDQTDDDQSTDDQDPNDQQNDPDPDEDSDEDAAPASATLLITKIEDTGEQANPNALELTVVSHEFPTGKEKELATLTSHYQGYDAVYAADKKIYYLTLSLQPGVYDLETGDNKIINIPGVDNSNDGYAKGYTLADFAFDQGKILYMKGECTEKLKCTVGIYDIASKTNKVLMEDFMQVIEPVFLNVTRIESFDADSGTAILTDNGGDAGYGKSVYYELNVNTGKITKIDTLESFACGDEADSMMGPCDANQTAQNEHHEEVAAKQFLMCGDVKVWNNQYWRVTLESDDESEEIEDASFVACQ